MEPLKPTLIMGELKTASLSIPVETLLGFRESDYFEEDLIVIED